MNKAMSLSATTPGLFLIFLHIAVLVAMGIAQPVYDLLGQYPQFLVAHKAGLLESFVLILILSFGIALALTGASLIARRIHPGLGRLVLYAVVAALTALLLLQVTKRLEVLPPLLQLAVAGLVGLITAHFYHTQRGLRNLLTVISPVIVIFPLLFIWHSPATKELSLRQPLLLGPSVQATTPVVLIIFDELPTTTLMAQDGSIDAKIFPAFSELSRHSTWFRNATTVASGTLKALPAILTGRDPVSTHVPTYTDYPENIFTLLGASYQMQAAEPITQLCPESLCRNSAENDTSGDLMLLLKDVGVVFLHIALPDAYTTSLPDVNANWKGFSYKPVDFDVEAIDKDGPPNRAIIENVRQQAMSAIAAIGSEDLGATFESSLAALDATKTPFLHVQHVPLPHVPWRYLPSGKQYRDLVTLGITEGGNWNDEQPWLIAQAFQRHLLQTAYVDTLLAKAIARLRSTGLYDDVLLIVTADHGASFKPGVSRRDPEASNLADLAGIPLFVKLPQQRAGTVSDKWVNNTDILPTIIEVLGISSPWPLQGISVFARTQAENPTLFLYASQDRKYNFDGEKFAARNWILDWKAELFGANNTLGNLFAMGPGRALVGQSLANFSTTSADNLSGTINYPHWFQNVVPYAVISHSRISGRTGAGGNRLETKLPQTLLIAINGQIVGTGETFTEKDEQGLFSIMVPEEAFSAGFNLVEVFELSNGDAKPPVLRQVASNQRSRKP